jgi:CBS domain-containing protein
LHAGAGEVKQLSQSDGRQAAALLPSRRSAAAWKLLEHLTEAAMSTVSEILGEKGSRVFTIDPHSTVFDAIAQMVRHGVGALVVIEEESVLGIITERDYLRKVAIEGRTSRTTMVHEIMSSPVLAVRPGDDMNECLALMTEKRVRHLPVIDHGALIGLVSIGDLVKHKVRDQQGEIDRLFDYIQTSSGAPAY